MSVEIPAMPAPERSNLSALASTLNADLPDSYLDFVTLHDGARPESNSFAVGRNSASSVRQFISVVEAQSVIGKVDGFPAGMLPFAEDDCGNYVYLNPASGEVHFWDHELNGPDQSLAPDLQSFLDELTPFDRSKVRLAPSQVKRVWVNPTFKPKF